MSSRRFDVSRDAVARRWTWLDLEVSMLAADQRGRALSALRLAADEVIQRFHADKMTSPAPKHRPSHLRLVTTPASERDAS